MNEGQELNEIIITTDGGKIVGITYSPAHGFGLDGYDMFDVHTWTLDKMVCFLASIPAETIRVMEVHENYYDAIVNDHHPEIFKALALEINPALWYGMDVDKFVVCDDAVEQDQNFNLVKQQWLAWLLDATDRTKFVVKNSGRVMVRQEIWIPLNNGTRWQHRLYYYKTLEEARRAYDEMAERNFDEYSYWGNWSQEFFDEQYAKNEAFKNRNLVK